MLYDCFQIRGLIKKNIGAQSKKNVFMWIQNSTIIEKLVSTKATLIYTDFY